MGLFGSAPAPLTKSDLILAVRNYLDKNDWHYKYDSEKQRITCGVSLESKLKHADMTVIFNDNGFTVYGTSQLSADNSSMAEVAKYLHGANYGLRNGNFELDFRDGEVRYKVYVNTKTLTSLPNDIIDDAVLLPFIMLDKYGNGLAAVIMGFSSADDALKTAEA